VNRKCRIVAIKGEIARTKNHLHHKLMSVTVNLRHLENKNVQLEGEVPANELDLNAVDELIHANEPLRYEIEVERNGPSLLVHGKVNITLDCECSRCLRPFKLDVNLDPYDALIALEGEDKVPIDNDVVDLTPHLREDILLAFPQHPLCEAECDRLPQMIESKPSGNAAEGQKSAWDELNKLKFK
jgi:uncharacterized protein